MGGGFGWFLTSPTDFVHQFANRGIKWHRDFRNTPQYLLRRKIRRGVHFWHFQNDLRTPLGRNVALKSQHRFISPNMKCQPSPLQTLVWLTIRAIFDRKEFSNRSESAKNELLVEFYVGVGTVGCFWCPDATLSFDCKLVIKIDGKCKKYGPHLMKWALYQHIRYGSRIQTRTLFCHRLSIIINLFSFRMEGIWGSLTCLWCS